MSCASAKRKKKQLVLKMIKFIIQLNKRDKCSQNVKWYNSDPSESNGSLDG